MPWTIHLAWSNQVSELQKTHCNDRAKISSFAFSHCISYAISFLNTENTSQKDKMNSTVKKKQEKFQSKSMKMCVCVEMHEHMHISITYYRYSHTIKI